MPTVGKTTNGASTRNMDLALRGLRVTMPEAGVLANIKARIQGNAGDRWRAFLFAATGGSLLASSSVVTGVTTVSWVNFTGFGVVNLTNGTSYDLVLGCEGTNGVSLIYFTDPDTFDGRQYEGLGTVDIDAIFNPLTDWNTTTRDYDINMEYNLPATGVKSLALPNGRRVALPNGRLVGV